MVLGQHRRSDPALVLLQDCGTGGCCAAVLAALGVGQDVAGFKQFAAVQRQCGGVQRRLGGFRSAALSVPVSPCSCLLVGPVGACCDSGGGTGGGAIQTCAQVFCTTAIDSAWLQGVQHCCGVLPVFLVAIAADVFALVRA